MRIIRFMFATMVATQTLTSLAMANDVEPVEYIVSSQVVSDEVTSPGMISGDGGGCAPGSACAEGMGGSVLGGSSAGGGLGGRLAGGFAGDIRQGGFAGDIQSGCVPRTYGYPDLFYNYYTQGNCNATNAQMYIAPVPVPPNVGHTFYTYQPFMPQEMLYWHKDRFHNYYDGGRGMNHTKVHYFAPPIRQATSNFYWNHLRIPR
jgi:hypothetical protein